ncbi:MAG: hypothetical protein OEZ14_07310 [Acidimicrobiia bacterium]|nr:hypothetical protein [Acidimicrobiia bacterium]
MHPLIWIGAIVGGVAFWRRKRLKDDATKVKSTAMEAKAKAESRIAHARGADHPDGADDEAGVPTAGGEPEDGGGETDGAGENEDGDGDTAS